MNNLLVRLKKYSKILYWIFIFLLTAFLLFIILPREPKFKYEYQKGFPWRHENLVAPFNFALLKSAEEIEQEKIEHLKSVVPYFSVDTTVIYEKLALLESDWKKITESAGKEMPEIFSALSGILVETYRQGILPRSPETYEILANKDEIKKITGNLAEKVPVSQIYSAKTAYNTINEAFKEIIKKSAETADHLNLLTPLNYIEPNLAYDSQTTQKETDQITGNISVTRGMIHTGERIILEGELVNDEKFQILESLKDSYEREWGKANSLILISTGQAVLVVIFVILIFLYLFIYRYDLLNEIRKLTFLLLFFVSVIMISHYINSFPNLHIYLVPFAIFPIIVRTFFDSRTAIFTLILASIITGFLAPNHYEFVLLQITAGVIAVFSLNKMHRRIHLIMAAVWVFLTYAIVYGCLGLIYEGSFNTIDYNMLKWFALSSVLILLVYPLVFVFEKMFGFVSDVTLIELSDTNQPLLRKLAEEAPGTFQHSMQIANLAEEIILKIGGNPFRVRAGALYHDIGKISSPGFFIENQEIGINPHDQMSYTKSAEIIIDHVNKGVRLAKKHKLPESLIEFIATHHGTTKAKYFYLKHQESNAGEVVDESSFAYPGPLPRTKEAAVVMLVDGIEAASRSLKEKTADNLKNLINNMIDQKIKDNQLEQSDLTFRDIKIIKETLVNKLLNIYHGRIEYPKDKS
ncbi:MAG: HDIG domain-containing protein [Prolixibacteraceae bacterium]|nr:HDIG domain-containing protein [Prolixibacteraceae bacterium]